MVHDAHKVRAAPAGIAPRSAADGGSAPTPPVHPRPSRHAASVQTLRHPVKRAWRAVRKCTRIAPSLLLGGTVPPRYAWPPAAVKPAARRTTRSRRTGAPEPGGNDSARRGVVSRMRPRRGRSTMRPLPTPPSGESCDAGFTRWGAAPAGIAPRSAADGGSAPTPPVHPRPSRHAASVQTLRHPVTSLAGRAQVHQDSPLASARGDSASRTAWPPAAGDIGHAKDDSLAPYRRSRARGERSRTTLAAAGAAAKGCDPAGVGAPCVPCPLPLRGSPAMQDSQGGGRAGGSAPTPPVHPRPSRHAASVQTLRHPVKQAWRSVHKCTRIAPSLPLGGTVPPRCAWPPAAVKPDARRTTRSRRTGAPEPGGNDSAPRLLRLAPRLRDATPPESEHHASPAHSPFGGVLRRRIHKVGAGSFLRRRPASGVR